MVWVAVTSLCPAASETVVEGEADEVEAPAVAALDLDDRMEDAAAAAEAEAGATEPADAAIEETELGLAAAEAEGVPAELPDDPAAAEDDGAAPDADIGGLPETAEDTGCTEAAGDWAEDVAAADCAAEDAGVAGEEAGAAELGGAEDTTGAADELALEGAAELGSGAVGEAEEETTGGAGVAVDVGEEEAGAELGDELTVVAGLGLALGVRLFGGGAEVPAFTFTFEEGEGSVEGGADSADVETDEMAIGGPVEAIDETICAGDEDEVAAVEEAGVGGREEGDENADDIGVEVEVGVAMAGGGSDGPVGGDAMGDDDAGCTPRRGARLFTHKEEDDNGAGPAVDVGAGVEIVEGEGDGDGDREGEVMRSEMHRFASR
ncbi:hypothetical protein EHS25_006413 [Saitozyma podzolica]|uniref:Uncharacterized protein n=1 Tax=Saitozyma podzolica TaxID=1890683 RepID=A0A427YRT2_9TREE|nr:hypothetical protein EHS25_006413 [Saitozyma podzolica]